MFESLRLRWRERRLIKALTILAIERARVSEVIFKSKPADCYGDDCSTCRCDLAPDCQ